MKDGVEVDAGDNEDDDTISDSDQLYSPPSSTRFLSFSDELQPIGLKKVYVRQAYIDIYDKYIKDNKFVLVCGNPGIGKSVFLFYVVRRLLDDHPRAKIVYEESGSSYRVYLTEDEVQFVKLDQLDKASYYLFDCRSPRHTVDINIARRSEKTIVMSSPAKQNYKSFEKDCVFSTLGRGVKLYMPIWTWEEVRFCGDHLWNEPLSQEVLERRFDVWGGVPRMLFRMPLDDKSADHLVNNAISHCNPSMVLKLAKEPYSGEFDDVSHRILHMHVVGDDYRVVAVKFATDKVAQGVFDRLMMDYKSAFFDFMEYAAGKSLYATVYGQLFESFCHSKLCSGEQFDVKSLEPGGEMKRLSWEGDTRVFKELDEVDGSTDKYFVPNKRNFIAVDSILPPDLAFQMTVSTTHPVIRHGLTLVKKLLQCAKLNLYFVVPKEIYDEFKKQPYHTHKKKVYKNAVTDVSQWAVCVNIQLFRSN